MEKRLRLVFVLYIILFILVILRLFHWQVQSREMLTGLSHQQLLRSTEIIPKRGSFLASDGSPLVINQPAFAVFGETDKIKNKNEVARILSEILSQDQAALSAKLNKEDVKWVSLADKIEAGLIGKIKEKSIMGLSLSEDNKRYYPESSMAAHLLGFVGKNHNGQDEGYFGLEGYYNEQIKGRSGLIKDEKDALGNQILAGNRLEIAVEDGRNLHLTIDKTVQFVIEEKLAEGIQKYGAKSGTVIVMNPKNGEIKGMASFPSYIPDKRLDFDTGIYKNPAIASAYEPGSTFKILVMSAAINEGKIAPNDEFNEAGPVEIGKYAIKTWNHQYHGRIKIPQILQYSSNVGMVYIQEKLGKDNLFKYFKKLEMGQLTGIDLQDESSPDLRPLDQWYAIDFATASFGQGIAVTPIQMIRMASSIANGGLLVTPHVVNKITDSQGKTIKINAGSQKRIFKKETAAIVTDMMVAAVEKGETKFLKPVGIKIAGKTGTAQIPIAGHYDEGKTIASFVGFLPAENPQLIMLVTLSEPTSSPWGSETAAPLFFNIAKELIAYYNIPFDF